MSGVVKATGNKRFLERGIFEKRTVGVLEAELEKGMRSVRNGEIYTIEKAWEEINKI